MNTKAAGLIELIVFLIIIVVTSAGVLLLIKYDVIMVKADSSSEPVLNAEFIPYVREGSLVVKEFQFCEYVDENYLCYGETNSFEFGQQIHFRFLVESSTYNGQLMVVKNFRVKGPSGEILLDVGDQQRRQFDQKSSREKEMVFFKDYFVVGYGAPLGDYTFELIVENPLITKTATLSQKFTVGEFNPEEGEEEFIEEGEA